MSFTILVTAPVLAPAGQAVLDRAGCRTLFVTKKGGAGQLSDILARESVDGVISRTLPMTAEMIGSCRTLKVISRHGTGFNNVDVAAATKHRIPVLVASGTNSQSVAELTIGLMIAAARNVVELDDGIRGGEWPRSSAGVELAGKTLGLVAYGAVARKVERMAASIGMRVMVFDPYLPSGADVARAGTLEELFAASDVISLHCPLNGETENMIGSAALGAMKRGVIIINTARGGLIDEAALAGSIRSGHVRAAGLDTLAEEPPARDHPLMNLRQVVLTPHMGGSTDAALANTAKLAANNALTVLAGKIPNPSFLINPQVLEEHPL